MGKWDIGHIRGSISGYLTNLSNFYGLSFSIQREILGDVEPPFGVAVTTFDFESIGGAGFCQACHDIS